MGGATEILLAIHRALQVRRGFGEDAVRGFCHAAIAGWVRQVPFLRLKLPQCTLRFRNPSNAVEIENPIPEKRKARLSAEKRRFLSANATPDGHLIGDNDLRLTKSPVIRPPTAR